MSLIFWRATTSCLPLCWPTADVHAWARSYGQKCCSRRCLDYSLSSEPKLGFSTVGAHLLTESRLCNCVINMSLWNSRYVLIWLWHRTTQTSYWHSFAVASWSVCFNRRDESLVLGEKWGLLKALEWIAGQLRDIIIWVYLVKLRLKEFSGIEDLASKLPCFDAGSSPHL